MRKILALCLASGLSLPAFAVPATDATAPAPSSGLPAGLLQSYSAVTLRYRISINEPNVLARINGVEVKLIVDTGTPLTSITANCAARLHLSVHDTGRYMDGANGRVAGNVGLAKIQSLAFRIGAVNRLSTLVVMPAAAHLSEGIDGVLGLDALVLNSAILPVGRDALLLKPGNSPPVDVKGFFLGLGFHALPLQLRSGHLWVEGHINWHPVHLMVDTGASFSGFRLATIQATRQSLASLPVTPKGFDGRTATVFGFTPHDWEIGGLELAPTLLMAADLSIFQVDKFDGLLGEDVMASHRAIIDLGHRVLWMK